MHFRDAQTAYVSPSAGAATTLVPLSREPMSAERTHIENKIASKRQQIARLAQEIHWLTMELES